MKKYSLMALLLFSICFAGHAQVKQYRIENNGLVLPFDVLFESGSDVLKPESDSALKYVKQYLDDKTYITLLRIEGHVAEGTPNARELSQKRAVAVCRWLVAKGISCSRLIPVGFGSTKPAADNSTPEGRAANTRIEFKNAALRGRAIGGMPVDGGGEVAGDPCL